MEYVRTLLNGLTGLLFGVPAPASAVFKPEREMQISNVDLLSWTFGNIEQFANHQIYVNAADPKISLTGREALVYVRQIIAGLKARGIGSGDNICVLSFNNVLYSPLYLGIIGAGACVVGANPAYGHTELKHILSVSKVKAIVVQPELVSKLLPAARECGIDDSNILIFDTEEQHPPQPFESWWTLLKHGESDWIRFDDEAQSKATTAAMMSTSGTTGLPKAAIISHYAQVAQSMLLYDSAHKPYTVRRLLCLPQFHAFAAPLFHCGPLREGHTTYIMKRYFCEPYLQYIQDYQITETAMVPPIVLDLISQTAAKQQMMQSLRYMWCAGAPLSGKSQKQIYGFLHPDAIFSQVWGLSEIGWITTFHYSERDDTGSVGRLLPGMEGRIVGPDGNAVTADQQKGEIFVRGPSIMNGYLANEAATRYTIEDGWLNTGDIGYVENGKWYICDRAKEIIKVKGWQVSPTELEECLIAHPAVLDAAVVGIEIHKDEGEVPRAYIVPQPGIRETITAGEIRDWVKGRLAKFKALTGGVVMVEKIPKAASGKVLRKQLKDQAILEMKSVQAT